MKFSIKDLFSFRRKLQIRSHLVKKSLMENFIFCGKYLANIQLIQYNNVMMQLLCSVSLTFRAFILFALNKFHLLSGQKRGYILKIINVSLCKNTYSKSAIKTRENRLSLLWTLYEVNNWNNRTMWDLCLKQQ